jgi:hypothetical protein
MHPLAIAYEWTERNKAARDTAPDTQRPGAWLWPGRWVRPASRTRTAPPLPELTDVPRPVLPAGPS